MTKKKGSDNHIFRYDELEYSSEAFLMLFNCTQE